MESPAVWNLQRIRQDILKYGSDKEKTRRLQVMLCSRWQGGAASLPRRRAHFLRRPLQRAI